MALRVTTEPIGKKLHRLWISSDGHLIGEYERSQEADIARKRKEVANCENLLISIFEKYGPFVVRWNSRGRRKSIRVNDVEIGEVPRSAWESPSWEA